MKNVLLFLLLIGLIICHPPFDREERQKRRRQFQKEMADCIVKSDSVSAELKKQIEDNIDDDLRKVLHLYMTKLDSNDREIIRKCRRELFGKMREMHRGRFHGFNRTHNFPFHHERHNNSEYP